MCHYCDYQQPTPHECPECGAAAIHFRGLGTQRLEAEVRARFPEASVLRMDTDAMQSPGSHDRALAAFRDGKVQILLGTQMIAKGLDFPNVTLVGVINADTALHLPDFRAAERTFQLVTQVAGRTGRGEKGGRVLVQTFSPEHPAIRAAVKHDFGAFAGEELPIRQAHGYPPTAAMIRLIVRGISLEQTKAMAQTIGDRLRAAMNRFSPVPRVLGPAAAPFAKLRGHHRFHLQLQGPDGDVLRTGASGHRRNGTDGKPVLGRRCRSARYAVTKESDQRTKNEDISAHCSGLAAVVPIKWILTSQLQAVNFNATVAVRFLARHDPQPARLDPRSSCPTAPSNACSARLGWS